MSKRLIALPVAAAVLMLTAACSSSTATENSVATISQQTLAALISRWPCPPKSLRRLCLPIRRRPRFCRVKPRPRFPTVQFLSPTPAPATPLPKGATPTLDPTTLLTRTITAKCNAAFFVGDVGLMDNSDVKAGSQFTKTWSVRNIGYCTWTPRYRLVFQYGQHMAGPNFINFPQIVAPNQGLFLSVTLTAPTGAGIHQGQWYIFDPDGNRFGVGDSGYDPLLVRIIVVP